jgi:multiple sugar transport system ATP-binding protein
MVFQDYGLYPHLSVRENIAFPLRLARTPEPELRRRVAATADLLELAEHLDSRPSQLTGSQRQRVALGRAIVREPAAFLFDEPLSTVDLARRGPLHATLGRLRQQRRTTTVYATDDQDEALALGDRVAVLHEGVLQQVDAPQRLCQRPANLFVAGFVGSPAMDLVPAGVHGTVLRLPDRDDVRLARSHEAQRRMCPGRAGTVQVWKSSTGSSSVSCAPTAGSATPIWPSGSGCPCRPCTSGSAGWSSAG